MTIRTSFKSNSAKLIMQCAYKKGLKVDIISTRFHLFRIQHRGIPLYFKGTSFPVNPQPSCIIANNKFLSKKILRSGGLLTPKSYLVRTAKEAITKVVEKNMFPCVIKPTRGAHGNKVYAKIEDINELQELLPYVFDRSVKKDFLLEEFIDGKDYRVLVVDDKVSAAMERVPAHVVGDGISTIRQLVSQFNKHPLVGNKYEKPMCKIRFNGEVKRILKKQGRKLTYIPAKKELVWLRQNANISTGGIGRDATDGVSNRVKKAAIMAAKAIGMKITGVDIIEDRLSKEPYILELNDCPGIDIHHFPVVGKPRDVAGDILNYVFTGK